MFMIFDWLCIIIDCVSVYYHRFQKRGELRSESHYYCWEVLEQKRESICYVPPPATNPPQPTHGHHTQPPPTHAPWTDAPYTDAPASHAPNNTDAPASHAPKTDAPGTAAPEPQLIPFGKCTSIQIPLGTGHFLIITQTNCYHTKNYLV